MFYKKNNIFIIKLVGSLLQSNGIFLQLFIYIIHIIQKSGILALYNYIYTHDFESYDLISNLCKWHKRKFFKFVIKFLNITILKFYY